MEKKNYFYWGLTAFLTVCALLVFYDTVFRNGVLLALGGKLLVSLKPVIYGAAMAYLLSPLVNALDHRLYSLTKGGKKGLIRALSILISWTVVFFAFYLLFRILVPQLYQSVTTLVGNMQNYYNTVYSWVTQLLHDNPALDQYVSDNISQYWDKVTAWFTDTFLPQAQQTLSVLTSGVVSVVGFLKDFLVGVIISVYLLVLKEQFTLGGRKILYSWTTPKIYVTTLRAIRRCDMIFSGFFRGKLIDSLIIGVLCFLGCSLLKIPYTPLISVIVGITNIIPFFGPFLGALPSAFLILLVDPMKCLTFIVFVLVLQQVDGNIIGPRILGDSTELPSFWVIVAILLGGGFFGILGMFLGVPVFACFYAAFHYYTYKRLRDKGILYDEMLSSRYDPAPTDVPKD